LLCLAAFGLALGGYLTRDIWTAEAQSATIETVAIDLDPTNNTAISIGAGAAGIDAGDIQSTRTAPVNGTVSFDIVVDEIPQAPEGGLYGVGGNLGYDSSVLEVIEVGEADSSYLQLQGEIFPFQIVDDLPDSDGSFRF
jgi:hypothetical protein